MQENYFGGQNSANKMMYQDVNLDSIRRIIGSSYEVVDHFEIFDFRKTIKGSGSFISNIGFTTGTGYNNMGVMLFNPSYAGRLAIWNVQFTPASDINITLTFPPLVTDDCSRFRNAFGAGGAVVTAGVATSLALKYCLVQPATGNMYFAIPPGAIVDVTGSAPPILQQVVAKDVFIYHHGIETSGGGLTLSNMISGIQRWDGSHFYGKFVASSITQGMPAAMYWAYVATDGVPIFTNSAVSIAADLSRSDMFFSAPFFNLINYTAVAGSYPAVSPYDPRNGYAFFVGKRFRPTNSGQINTAGNWFTLNIT